MKLYGERDWRTIKELTGASAIIYAVLKEDKCDLMTDYFASATKRTVAIGFRKSKRENFRKLREAAMLFEPTSHLGPDCGAFTVYARLTRDREPGSELCGSRWRGHPYVHAELHGKRYAQRSEAEDAIWAGEALPDGVEYQIDGDEKNVEHRDNYSMGHGNWIGVSRYHGWEVVSHGYFPGPFEISERFKVELARLV